MNLFFRPFLLPFFAFALCGCTSLFFQPSKVRYPLLEQDGFKVEESAVQSFDGTPLAQWYFPALDNAAKFPHEVVEKFSQPKALIVQFHGNAENMTTHYRFLSWLLFYGYDLLAFDYRGYGQSGGEKGVAGIYGDVKVMIRHAQKLAEEKNLPLIFVGQSLGGSLLLKALQEEQAKNLKLVVIESSFYGYQKIAREKLSSVWITWPFQWLSYLLISDKYSPGGKDLSKIQKVPKVLLYSESDPIVPIHHGELLFNELTHPKFFWRHPNPGHVNGFFVERGKYRVELLALLKAVTQ